MKFRKNSVIFFLLCSLIFIPSSLLSQQDLTQSQSPLTREEKRLEAMHSISSHVLLDYVKELCSEEYGGRLTGTPGYNAAAQWVANLLDKWDIRPAGDKGTYFQDFPNPYTLVFPGAEVVLHIPYQKNTVIRKSYEYETDFLPGSTSDTGAVKAEVIYVGCGITAPELGYDDYKGVDVRGKIVMMEREVPISPEKEPEVFKTWRPYSFHQYKLKNAASHGAAGMLYNYHIANPNGIFIKNFLVTYVGKTIIEDIFQGTGRTYQEVVEQIRKTRKPHSFNSKKIVSIRAVTQHHPEGTGRNVIGWIEGSDPELKKETVMIGAHLDHLGYNHKMMPGADDNASGVSVVLGIAKAIKNSGLKPRRSIIFIFFGAEEQGVKGSEYYLAHPFVSNETIVGYLNLDGVGRGKQVEARAGKNYPALWKFIDDANQKYIHRPVIPKHFHNLARPRLDAAHFLWAGVPTISFSAVGAEPLPYEYYHRTTDRPEILTPEIMEDLAQLLFIALMEIAGF